ncbi:MAG: hypothetical protein HYX53_13585 [Chloroflexi bacterium]|nr:hypothetical protein [Chloroflexota bacterium]
MARAGPGRGGSTRPGIYGPRQVAPSEWSVIRRVLDGRAGMILPDGGLVAYSRMGTRNAAHAVLLAVDRPAVAAGRIYNCADGEQLTLRQWMETIAGIMGARLECWSLPRELATAAAAIARAPGHVLVDTSRVRIELGYRDVLPVHEGLRETIAWYLANPVTRDDYPWLSDTFDYAAEDALVAAYGAAVAALSPPTEAVPPFVHPYAHPRLPHQARDHRAR